MVYVVMLGLLSYYAASYLDFLALQYISAGLGRLVLFLYPTIVVLLSAAFLARPIAIRELIALVLTYAGLALVLLHSFDGNRDVLLGAALAMASSLCYAVYLVAGSQVIARVGSMRFSAYAMIAATDRVSAPVLRAAAGRRAECAGAGARLRGHDGGGQHRGAGIPHGGSAAPRRREYRRHRWRVGAGVDDRARLDRTRRSDDAAATRRRRRSC